MYQSLLILFFTRSIFLKMKKHLLLYLFLFPILLSAQLTWENLTSPPGSEIIKILAGPDEFVYLQLRYDNFYRSANNGEDWEVIPLPPSTSINSWTVAGDGSIYALLNNSIFYLPSGTDEWVLVPSENSELYLNTFITVYPNGDLMVIDEIGTMYYLEEGSETWETFYEGNSGIFDTKVTLGDDGHYFLYMYDVPTQRYNIQGDPPVNIQLPTGTSGYPDLKRHPEGGMWLLSNDRVFRSANNGANWTEVPTEGVSDVRQIDFGRDNAIYLYDLYRASGYRSVDNGENWEPLDNLLSVTGFGGIPVVTSADTELFYNQFCGQSILARTTDNGATYENLTANLPNPRINNMIGRTTERLFAQTCALDWQQSADEGISWNGIRIDNQIIREMSVGPNNELIALDADNEVYISLDEGTSWNEITVPIDQWDDIIKVNYFPNHLIAVVDNDHKVYYSNDGGATFQTYDAIHGAGNVCYHPSGYLFTTPPSFTSPAIHRINISDNTSQVFTQPTLNDSYSLQFTVLPSGVIYYLGYFPFQPAPTKLFRSDDMGETFTEVFSQILYPPTTDGDDFIAQDLIGRHYFLAGDEILVSIDQGMSWQPFLTDVPGLGQGGIFIDQDDYLYLIRYRGDAIYRSTSPLADLGSITGTIWNDSNYDCATYDTDEYPLSFWSLQATNGVNTYYGYSNPYGDYSIFLPEGSYTVSAIINTPLFAACATDQTINVVEGEVSTTDFPMEPTLLCPLVSANISTPLLRRCFDNTYTVSVCNDGTLIAEDATIEITLDDFFVLISSSIPTTEVNGQVYTFALGDLPPGSCTTFSLRVNISCEAELGQEHCISWTTTPGNECAPSFQTDTNIECQINIGSYDPNDKRAFVDGREVTDYLLPETERMIYHIRFQNTGTDTAFTVEIEDQLPAALDLTTFHLENSSHPCEVNFSPGLTPNTHKVNFVFRDILLPDSTTNEAASHGFVKFSIAPKAGLELGENINNFADIFFDFNDPVRTNTVALEYNFPDAVDDLSPEKILVAVYPNPTTGQVNILLKDGLAPPLNLILYNTQGQAILRHQLTQKSNELNISHLPKGLYFLQIVQQEELVQVMKVVVQ